MGYKINVEIDIDDSVDFADASAEIQDMLDSKYGEAILAINITDDDLDDEL